MEPSILGGKYDKIARWWQEQHDHSRYGIDQLQRALTFTPDGGLALDAGCGAGGRMIRMMQAQGFAITGVDVSQEMLKLARENHPGHDFIHADLCSWETEEKFDFILAWDSLFHLPFDQQRPVVSKLCRLLAGNGVLIYSFGDAVGEHTDQWRGDTFYYSSIGVNENLALLMSNGLSILHLELDQYPEKHAYVIARKPRPERSKG